MNDAPWALKAIVIVLAVIGLLAVSGIAGMAAMHIGMMHGFGFCRDGMSAWR